jgi:hypothetical protein
VLGHILSTSRDALRQLFVVDRRIVACGFSHPKLGKKSMLTIGFFS